MNLRSAASDTAGAGRKERQREHGEGQRTAVKILMGSKSCKETA